MPIYQYRCENCKDEMEFLQSMSDKPKKKCPSCNKMKLKKILAPFGFRLKGKDWFRKTSGMD